MLEDIAGPCRPTARVAHAAMQRRAALFRVVRATVQDIGIVEYRLAG
jgi:hypothetical protein